jgi:hypothetical protein
LGATLRSDHVSILTSLHRGFEIRDLERHISVLVDDPLGVRDPFETLGDVVFAAFDVRLSDLAKSHLLTAQGLTQ